MEQGCDAPWESAWTQRAPLERRAWRAPPLRRGPLVAIVAVHVVLVLLAIRTIRANRAPPPVAPDEVLVVDLIAPDAVSGVAPALRVAPIRRAREPARNAIVEPAAAPAEPEIGLFDAHGALVLPGTGDTFERRAPAATPAPRRATVVYTPTRFEKYFVRDKETLGQRLVRKVPLLGIVLSGVNAPNCGDDPDRVNEECDPQRAVQDLNALVHPFN